MNGRAIVTQEIQYTMDQIIIPTENWPSGQYTCTLFADGRSIKTQKITISK
jgi:hypothetical protein